MCNLNDNKLFTLVKSETNEDYEMLHYRCNNIVINTDEHGKVCIEAVIIFNYTDSDYSEVRVYNDTQYVYADALFEANVSKLFGFDVGFTEAGMQDVGIASMET
jgi:hypothetical protein